MFRSLGQILAVVAIVATAVNAQCALSCSLKASTQSSAYDDSTSGTHLTRIGHACCPGQKSPEPSNRSQQKQPCPDPSLPVMETKIASFVQFVDASHFVSVASCLSFDEVLYVNRVALLTANDSLSSHDSPAFSVLRV